MANLLPIGVPTLQRFTVEEGREPFFAWRGLGVSERGKPAQTGAQSSAQDAGQNGATIQLLFVHGSIPVAFSPGP
jgi:hypothetical protein